MMKDPLDKNGDIIFSNTKNRDANYRTDEEKIIIKVQDGLDLGLKCTGWVSDPKILLLTNSIDMN